MAQDQYDDRAIANLFDIGSKPSPVTGIAGPEFQTYTNAILAAMQPEFERQRRGLADQFRITGGAGSRNGGAFPRELGLQSGNQTTLATEAVLRNAIPFMESQRLAGESALDRQRVSNATVLGRGGASRPQEPIQMDPNREADRQLQRELAQKSLNARPDQPGRYDSIVNDLLRSLITGVPTALGADLLKPNSTLRSAATSLMGLLSGTRSNPVEDLGGDPGGDFDWSGLVDSSPWGGSFTEPWSGGSDWDGGDWGGWDFGGDGDGGDWSW